MIFIINNFIKTSQLNTYKIKKLKEHLSWNNFVTVYLQEVKTAANKMITQYEKNIEI